jgi:diaminopimelate epimerase
MLRNFVPSAPTPAAIPEFFKMAGGGNDFLVFDNRTGAIREAENLALAICTRRLSVGGDGIILIENSARATFRMRYLNADGSLAEFCGNGTRCAARFAYVNVIAPKRMTIETGAGIIGAEVIDQNVGLTLQPPASVELDRPLRLGDGRTIRGSYLRVGVPHYVVFLREKLWEQQIEPLGRELRFHPDLAPEGANVNFVVVRNRSLIEVRTYERGVEGETLSCGSGVVASAAVSALFNRVDAPVTVRTRSGILLQVPLIRDGASLADVRLVGDARIIYRARVTPETLEGFDPKWVRNPTDRRSEP